MKLLNIFTTLLLFTIISSYQTYDQFIDSTPSTFGLLTVTHARNGIYTYFRNHLEMYATMDCPEMTEVSIVWNNDVAPELVGFAPSSSWKRPVYFRKTPYNSMDFRYLLPKESKAKVFFSIDDDIIITCNELIKSFAYWKQHAVGDIGPLVSYMPRSFNFYAKKSQFTYTDQLEKKLFTISLVGVSWISRLFLQLYNSDQIWQTNIMRELVREKNNCDDIALNYIVNYFFPELLSKIFVGNITHQTHPASQSLTKQHYQYRNMCVKKFSQMLGFNPLKIVHRSEPQPLQNGFPFKSRKMAIYLRKIELEETYVKQIQFKQSNVEALKFLGQYIGFEREQIKKVEVGQIQTIGVRQLKKKISQVKLQTKAKSEQTLNLNKEIKQRQFLLNQLEDKQKMLKDFLEQKARLIPKYEQLLNNIKILLGFLFLASFGLYLCLNKWRCECDQASNKQDQSPNQNQELKEKSEGSDQESEDDDGQN